jgi:hypothetical protein
MYEITRKKKVTSYDDARAVSRVLLAAAEWQSDLISLEVRFVSFV